MRLFVCMFQYYEMSYGLNVEMHKQVSFCYQPRFFRIFSRLTKRLRNHFCVLKYDLLQDIYIPAAPAPAEGRGACSPTEKLPPPWASAWEGLLPVLRMHTLLERSYSTRTNMKRTNFSRQFDKLDLNFQTVYTHSQSSGHIRIQSEIIVHIRTALSLIFQHCNKTWQIQKRQTL